MKKQLAALFILTTALNLLVTGCKQKKTAEKKEVVAVDSATFNANPDQFQMIPDEHTKERNELAKIAYGDIKFGITEKQYQKVVPDENIKIENCAFKLSPFYNKNGKLESLNIEGVKLTGKYFYAVQIPEMEVLIKKIVEKYGPPTEPVKKIFISSFKDPGIKYAADWVIKSKRIMIGIYNTEDGSEYSSYCSISNDDFEREPYKGKEEKRVEQKPEASKF